MTRALAARAGAVLALGLGLLTVPAAAADEPTSQGTPAPVVWVFGDSIAAGTWLDDPPTQSWPAQLDVLLGPGTQVRNFGVGGQTVAYDQPGGQRMDDLVRQTLSLTPSDQLPDVIVFAGGINDLIRAADTGATRWAVFGLSTWVAANYPTVDFYVDTLTPYRSGDPYSDPLSSRRADYNAWVRAQYGPAGRLIDAGDILAAGATYADVRFFRDQVHPNARGAAIYADAVATILVERGLD